MTDVANGYILNVPANRRSILLQENDHGGSFRDSPYLAEPVPKFQHPQNASLVVFASFSDGMLTHIAEGRKGKSGGTGLVRLSMNNLSALSHPISYVNLIGIMPVEVRQHFQRVITEGGLLPPKTLIAFVDRIIELDPSIAGILSRYSSRYYEGMERLKERERENLAIQKEAVGTALTIFGVPRDELRKWQPAEGQWSFLDGLPEARRREDIVIIDDFDKIPGIAATRETTRLGSRTFQSSEKPSVRLTVLVANRTALEKQMGTDLIYFNEIYRCFLMVQYKLMEVSKNGRSTDVEFRWREGDQFFQELQRMDDTLVELQKLQSPNVPNGFRFSENPFFLKFCSRVTFNPDDTSLSKGMYFPLDLWKRLVASGQLKGTRGGNLLTFGNAGRYINNTEFVALVSGSWVGTSLEQSEVLTALIRKILTSGKTVTYAIEHKMRDGSSQTV